MCKFCDKVIQVANKGYYALLQHAGGKSHKEKSVVRYTVSERESSASRKHEIDKQQSVCTLDQSKMEEKQLHAKDQNANTTEIKSLEGHD